MLEISMTGLSNSQSADFDCRMKRLSMTFKDETLNSKQNREAELKKSCMEMESLFVMQLMKEMRAAIPKSGLMDGGKAEEIYTSMLDNQYAKNITENGGLGIADQLYEQLTKKMGENTI